MLLIRQSIYLNITWIGLLIEDGHFTFPDRGYYNRTPIFQKTDTLFPMEIRIQTDGTAYVVRDYTDQIPKNAKVISINGHSAQELVLTDRAFSGEVRSRSYYANEDPDFRGWYNFANFLFMEGFKAPYRIEYALSGSERIDTATLGRMTREELYKAYRKSGTKAKDDNVWNLLFGAKTITTKKIGEHSAVMTIDYFWGENMFALLLFLTKTGAIPAS